MSTSKASKIQMRRSAPEIEKIATNNVSSTVATARVSTVWTTLYYCSVAVLAGLILITVMRPWRMDPRVAINDWGDCLFVQVLAKAVREGWWFQISNLAAPFGLDLIDTGMACTLDYVVFKIIGLFTSEPGLIVNLYWLTSVMLSAVSAAFCLRLIGVASTISFVLGILFALSPWTFWRNTAHVLLPLYLIPPVVLFAYLVFRGSIQVQSRKVQRSLIAALFATGLLHTYIPFFAACLLFAVLAFRAVIGFRDPSVRMACLGLSVLLLGTGLNLAPTIVYRAHHGSIPDLKQIQEADVYGLKIRHLITPIDHHPLPPFRWVAKKISDAGFPNENENVAGRLGTTGTLGFLLLLGYGLLILAKPGAPEWFPELKPLVFIVISMVLLGTIGGFGTLFNVFVTPIFRTYNRVSIFILFGSLAAVGLLVTRLSRSPHLARRLNPVLGAVLLTGWLGFGIIDQVFVHSLVSRHPADRQNFTVLRNMVHNVESVMAPGDAVFQLPHTEFIHEAPPGNMATYDHARVYLHSRKLRLSWGALTGRNDWARGVSQRPPEEMLDALLLAGFAGVWIDTAGYPGGASEITHVLARKTGTIPLESTNGRYMFFDIRPLRNTRLQRIANPVELDKKRNEVLHPVEIAWGDGFYGQERSGHMTFRWSQPDSAIELRNSLDRPRQVLLQMTAKGFFQAPLEINYRGSRETVQVGINEAPLVLRLDLPPNSSTPLRFRLVGPPTRVPTDPRSFGFMAINPSISDWVPPQAATAAAGR